MQREAFWFSFPFRVRYSEIDGQGVVFNAHYLTYYDTAITEYFRALPYDYLGEAGRTGTDFHVVRAVVEFKAPIRFDQEIQVGVRTARIGRSSLVLALAILPKNGAETLATGEIVWVNTDQASHLAVAVPDRLREVIRLREGDAAST